MQLSDFILQRLDEDEAVARWTQRGYQHVLGIRHYFSANNETSVAMTPRTALAEVAAKRRIVDRHGVVETGMGYDPDDGGTYGAMSNVCRCCGCFAEYAVRYPCDTLKFLALPYAVHKDYQSDWAV